MEYKLVLYKDAWSSLGRRDALLCRFIAEHTHIEWIESRRSA